jgi:dTDP-4-dehydrorhamnose 3,5-epimerase-like enzyme
MESVKLLEFPIFEEDSGELVVFEESITAIPFSIKRIFNVRSEKDSVRGKHAHRLCSQILICSNGSIQVTCDDSTNKEIYILDKPNYGLLVSPGIWAEQKYLKQNTSMTVICDRLYEAEDYISDYADFRIFANTLN